MTSKVWRLPGHFLFFSPTFFSWQKVEEKNVGEKNKKGFPDKEIIQYSLESFGLMD
jgi:hypothetical protein